MPTRFSDWRGLPFREIWVVDTEYYPGPGLAHGGQDGDLITPLCLVATEMRTAQTVRLWQDDLGPFPPYRLDANALAVHFMTTAEAGFHLALGWGQPANTVDAYIEFRHLMNDARAKAEDRPKGFYSLAGALRRFGEDSLDTAHKDTMRGRIIEGPPFSNGERADILRYCEDDARALVRLFARLVPTIPSLPHALFRGQHAWATARQERRGIPVDLVGLERMREYWDPIKLDLVATYDHDYGCYEIVDGKPHFRDDLFEAYLRRSRIVWPAYADGRPDKRADTFKDMARAYPQLGKLHELRKTMSKLRLNKLAVGRDGRNRTLLGPYGTKTGRNAPSNSKFMFGPAKCIRPLIMPPPGIALIHRDYMQQEVRIGAVKSGDGELLTACEQGDIYLGVAALLGFDTSRSGVRDLFKTVVLGIQYGMAAQSLAYRAAISLYEASEILARLKARFRKLEYWIANTADYAGLNMMLSTDFGWTVQCPPGTNPRTIRNWPIQSAGAEILHVLSQLAERRGINIVAPIHDAVIAEAPVADAVDVSEALDHCMRDAAAIVLQGYELPTDKQIIMPGERYYDKNGAGMWATINTSIARLERKTA